MRKAKKIQNPITRIHKIQLMQEPNHKFKD